MTGQVPPGWYRDPYGTPGLQRYWDGSQWTQATQPTDEWDDAASQQTPPGQPPEGAAQQPQAFGQQGQYAQQPQQAQPEWASPSAGPGWGAAPQQQYGWQPAPGKPPERNNTGLILGLAGGGFVVVVLLIAVILVASRSGGDPDPTTSPTTALTPAPSATTPVPGGGTSPTVGLVSDTQAGLSYPELGGTWDRATSVSSTDSLGKLGFTRGAVATVQRDYNGANSRYVASVYSGELNSTVSTNDLESAAKNLFRAVEPTSYPQPNTKLDLDSKSYSVSGKNAWYYKVQLSFPQARSRNWNFTKETIVIVTVERGSGKRPATFYVSIPDSHVNQGDLDLLLSSLRAQ
ncbi:DUF2510 domain-containing protein [Actinomadura sp. HBU206391]|uniref:DUF2510 domain-containing protein n=1 Tax=Actinomadura sp. HBU206391 TaxID=2731692 RepID=UPI001C9D0BA3|nr:DUF2510 domain-containing protein [Actinomadura sp. HBU206391]